MSFRERIKNEGISLRTLHTALIIIALLVSWYLIFSTFRLSVTFGDLSDATDQYIEMQKAASELIDATNYLVEMVQRYTLDGNSLYLHNYFEESLESRRREAAIEKMSADGDVRDAVEQLRKALESSSRLTERDYYAMKMVVEATGLSPVPEQLQDVELRPEHALLPAREKKEAAQHMVSDEEYYRQLDRIRTDMRESLAKLEEKTRSVQEKSSADLKADLSGVRLVTIIQTTAIFIMTLLTVRLGITPVLKAVVKIREDSPIPVVGANEFRYLARTYNKMYEVYKSSVANLNFRASHDELTKVYNRAGYDLLLNTLNYRNVGILLVDVDLFKKINDTYGHEVGDRILQKVAAAISRHFRSGDYVCRIGGDEFSVIMLHVNRTHRDLIAEKVMKINAALADTSGGLPPISVSAGAAFGDEAESAKKLYEAADEALYETKRRGRNGVSFYGETEPRTKE